MLSVFLTFGCKGSATLEVDEAHNVQTGQDTVTVKAGVTIQFGGATPKLSTGGSPTTIVESIPSNYIPDTSVATYVTLVATTDTGYTSNITLPTAMVSTSAAPANPGDVVYAWAVASTSASALDAWEQDVSAHTNSEVNIALTANVPLIGNGAAGTYTFTTSLQDSVLGSTNSASTSVTVYDDLGGGGGHKCPDNPSCPVTQLPPPEN